MFLRIVLGYPVCMIIPKLLGLLVVVGTFMEFLLKIFNDRNFGIMVKMGVFGVIRWLLPIFPEAVAKFDNLVIGLSVTGMIYASLIAIKQDDLKRLVAYSSIAHIDWPCSHLRVKA